METPKYAILPAGDTKTSLEIPRLTVGSGLSETLAPWAIKEIVDGFITDMLHVTEEPEEAEAIHSAVRLLYTEQPFWAELRAWGLSSRLDKPFVQLERPEEVAAIAIVKLVRVLGCICEPTDLRAAIGSWAHRGKQ